MTFILTAVVVLVASALQTATGFGFSILAVPLLLLLHTPLDAVQLNLIVSVFLSLLLLRQVRASVDTTLLKRLVPPSIAGAPVGLALLLYLDERVFKFSTAMLLLVFMVLLAGRLRFSRTPLRDYVTGFLAGIFTSAIGAGGLPLLLYFAGSNVQKAMARATAVTFFLFIYGIALVLQVAVEPGKPHIWLVSISLLPVAMAGIKIGQWIYAKLSQRAFTATIYVLLLANSLILLLDAVGVFQ